MTEESARQEDLQTVEVEKIDRPDVVDRITIDLEEIKSLSENIQEQGLLQAPVLREKDGRFEIVAGDRRIMAVKRLDWTTVKCVIKTLTDQQAAEIRASENLQRENLSVIEEARIYRNLNQKHHMPIDRIAQKMGKSPGTIKRRLDLLKMPDSLQNAMHEKKISYGVAEALWPIADPGALDYYLGFAIDHGVTVTIARQWTNDWKNSQRRIEDENKDPMEQLTSPAERPTYLACDLCQEPVLVQNLAVIRICRECAKKIT